MKLSERLELMLTARLTDEQSIIHEAMELAKRYEDAPVVELTECNQIPGATDFDWEDMQAAIAPMKSGQRVRVVLDKEG